MMTGQRKSDLGYLRLATVTCKGIQCINIVKYVNSQEKFHKTCGPWVPGSLNLWSLSPLFIPIRPPKNCIRTTGM